MIVLSSESMKYFDETIFQEALESKMMIVQSK